MLDEEAQTTLDGVDNINDAMRLNFAKDRTVQVIYKGAELGTYPWSALYGYYAIEMDDEAPIVGRVCMDQMMVDITDIPDVKLEDIVTLIGKDGDNFISVEDMANLAGSFNYEFVCDVGKRVPRVYKK